jgi:hypothetical protein
MTITPTALLSLPIITTGTESGTWGDVVDNGLTSYLDIAIAGGLAITITTADVTLTKTAGTSVATGITSSTAQYAILNISGAKTAARNLNLPATSKSYIINNAGTGGFLLTVRGVTPTTGVTLVDGEECIVAWNGTDFVKVASTVLTALTGTLTAGNGGTGAATLAANNVLLGNGTGALQVVAPGTSGNVLTSDGTIWQSTALPLNPQIQPISASVAASALTISASALKLDFRSTTLGSGTVTTVSGTPANLVISSGSTLGTVSAQQSRIVVIALNNAGTIELAAVNISGGNQLDETNLITTTAEGGAGAADSANVVYSTTARTSLAYRVIGFIQSTQATAGTWATAPSTIQGTGGQALTAMSSLGYGQTWQSVTGSRTSGTTYYNTTGKPIFVEAGVQAVSGTPNITVVVNGVTIVNYTFPYGTGNPLSFIVPPSASYSYTIAAGTTLNSWTELR